MKTLPLILTASLLAGCSAFYKSPVPGTEIRGEIAGVPFSLNSPKQAEMHGVELFIQTATNTFRLVIKDYESKNDPQVIDKASAGRVAEVNATFNGLNSFAEKVTKALAQGTVQGINPIPE
jgi:hypothetical protein